MDLSIGDWVALVATVIMISIIALHSIHHKPHTVSETQWREYEAEHKPEYNGVNRRIETGNHPAINPEE